MSLCSRWLKTIGQGVLCFSLISAVQSCALRPNSDKNPGKKLNLPSQAPIAPAPVPRLIEGTFSFLFLTTSAVADDNPRCVSECLNSQSCISLYRIHIHRPFLFGSPTLQKTLLCSTALIPNPNQPEKDTFRFEVTSNFSFPVLLEGSTPEKGHRMALGIFDAKKDTFAHLTSYSTLEAEPLQEWLLESADSLFLESPEGLRIAENQHEKVIEQFKSQQAIHSGEQIAELVTHSELFSSIALQNPFPHFLKTHPQDFLSFLKLAGPKIRKTLLEAHQAHQSVDPEKFKTLLLSQTELNSIQEKLVLETNRSLDSDGDSVNDAQDCNKNNPSAFKVNHYQSRDLDEDGVFVPQSGEVCSGETLPKNYSSTISLTDDCDDTQKTIFRRKSVYNEDMDRSETRCIGTADPPLYLKIENSEGVRLSKRKQILTPLVQEPTRQGALVKFKLRITNPSGTHAQLESNDLPAGWGLDPFEERWNAQGNRLLTLAAGTSLTVDFYRRIENSDLYSITLPLKFRAINQRSEIFETSVLINGTSSPVLQARFINVDQMNRDLEEGEVLSFGTAGANPNLRYGQGLFYKKMAVKNLESFPIRIERRVGGPVWTNSNSGCDQYTTTCSGPFASCYTCILGPGKRWDISYEYSHRSEAKKESTVQFTVTAPSRSEAAQNTFSIKLFAQTLSPIQLAWETPSRSLFPTSQTLPFGQVQKDQITTASLQVKNLSSYPLTLTNASATPPFKVVNLSLPLTLAAATTPGATRSIEVHFDPSLVPTTELDDDDNPVPIEFPNQLSGTFSFSVRATEASEVSIAGSIPLAATLLPITPLSPEAIALREKGQPESETPAQASSSILVMKDQEWSAVDATRSFEILNKSNVPVVLKLKGITPSTGITPVGDLVVERDFVITPNGSKEFSFSLRATEVRPFSIQLQLIASVLNDGLHTTPISAEIKGKVLPLTLKPLQLADNSSLNLLVPDSSLTFSCSNNTSLSFSMSALNYAAPQIACTNSSKEYVLPALAFRSKPEWDRALNIKLQADKNTVKNLDFLSLDLPVRPNLTDNSSEASRFNLSLRSLVLYNPNVTSAQDLAEYYAQNRNIPRSHLCPVRMPPGLYASTQNYQSARNQILKNCICPLAQITEPSTPCNSTLNPHTLQRLSRIDHLVFIRGWPARLSDVGENPSLDAWFANYLFSSDEGASGPFETNWGRIDGLTAARARAHFDRTLASEQKGFLGNVLTENASREPTKGGPSGLGVLLGGLLKPACFAQWVLEGPSWNPAQCVVGVSKNGYVPGVRQTDFESVPNVGFYLNKNPGPNTQEAFNGSWEALLKWRKTSDPCIAECAMIKDDQERTQCFSTSTDPFKILNTSCVGGSPSLMGFQLRSWPVKFFGFYPAGYEGNDTGAVDQNPPHLREDSTAYHSTEFSDDHYIRFGDPEAVSNPECLNIDGDVTPCPERLPFFMWRNFKLKAPLPVEEPPGGPRRIRARVKFQLRGELRNPDPAIQIWMNPYGAWETVKNKPLPLTVRPGAWTQHELDFEWTGGEVGSAPSELSVFFSASAYYGVSHNLGWLEMDAIEIFSPNSPQTNLIAPVEGSFAEPHRTAGTGTWASTLIERLGAIAWWGSSSHYETGGYAFRSADTVAANFMSGHSLGEAVRRGMGSFSGLFYGDPLYRPVAANIQFDHPEVRKLVWGGAGHPNRIPQGAISSTQGTSAFVISPEYEWRVPLQETSKLNSSVSVIAYNGLGNDAKIHWKLQTCTNETLPFDCDVSNSWSTPVASGTHAERAPLQAIEKIDSLIGDRSQSRKIHLRLEVTVEGEPNPPVYGYASFVTIP